MTNTQPTNESKTMTNEIIKAGKELATLNSENETLHAARKWWSEGCISRYSNQDFDVLNSLVCAITNENRKLGK